MYHLDSEQGEEEGKMANLPHDSDSLTPGTLLTKRTSQTECIFLH